MRDYKKFTVWQSSHMLVTKIYKEIIPDFPDSEKYGLSSQVRRAAYSIPLNIVEGCGRTSDKEFTRFLEISLGSAHELEYCLLLSKDLAFITEEQYQKSNKMINSLKAMIITLIKKIRSSMP